MAVRGQKLDLQKESERHTSQIIKNRELRKFINDHETGIQRAFERIQKEVNPDLKEAKNE